MANDELDALNALEKEAKEDDELDALNALEKEAKEYDKVLSG